MSCNKQKEVTKSGAGSSKARKYVYSDQFRFRSKLINERQTADTFSVGNMEESQFPIVEKTELLWIISPKKLLSFYLIIKFFFESTYKHYFRDSNSHCFYRLNAVPNFTVTTLKTLLQSAMQLVERWNWQSKIIEKLLFVISYSIK